MVDTGIVTFKNVSVLSGAGYALFGTAVLLFPTRAFRLFFPGTSVSAFTPFTADVVRGIGAFNIILAAYNFSVTDADRETKKRLSWTGLFSALLSTGLLAYLVSATNRWGGSSINHYRGFVVNALIIAAYGSLALSD
eukprot:TRINITY_DN4148_c0_g1_i1.p1 TRINITY_DN4148_c0_g1~~TRINITY_DN4148_c0_g1_i1.p1  ORF type:complete len:137 (+),score=20.34 TRINITY_DN4148_c0_g1_i1:44-454(+)